MEVRPGYKQTEVGVIPEEWEVRPLRSLAYFKTGPFGTLLKADEYSAAGGTPLISVRDIGDDGFLHIDEKTPRLPFSVVRRLPEYVLNIGDIVFGRKGAVDRSAMVSDSQGGWFLGSDGIRLRPVSGCHPQFIAYELQRSDTRGWLMQHATGTTMASLNQEILGRISIPQPPLPEQCAIAAALGDVDALIGALDRLIAKKRDLKQASMQQLLTGQTRLPGFRGEWGVVKFSDVADKTIQWSIAGGPFGSNLKASDYISEGVRIIQLQNIGDGRFHNDYEIFTSETKANELLSNNIYPGEIILSKMGDPVARACFVPSVDRRYLMASDGIRLAVDKKRFNKRFVHDYINSMYFRRKAIEASTGSSRQRIGLVELKQLPFMAPPLPEQTAIAVVLSDMDAEIAALEARRNKTRSLKQGMMQELLTGRTRLV